MSNSDMDEKSHIIQLFFDFAHFFRRRSDDAYVAWTTEVCELHKREGSLILANIKLFANLFNSNRLKNLSIFYYTHVLYLISDDLLQKRVLQYIWEHVITDFPLLSDMQYS